MTHPFWMESSRHHEPDEFDDSSSETEEIESVKLGTSSYESSTTTIRGTGEAL